MKQIEVADKIYNVHDETIIYPSGSPAIRNKLEVHMNPSEITQEEFEGIFANKKDLKEIKLREYNDSGEQLYESVCEEYTELLSIGKKRIDTMDPLSGKTTSEVHYVAELEQPLYIERLANEVEALSR